MYSIYSDMRRRSRGEALMAVPRSSAPVFGRYAGVQGVQSWHSCVGAPPDLGFRPVSPLGCWSAVRRGFQACFLKCCMPLLSPQMLASLLWSVPAVWLKCCWQRRKAFPAVLPPEFGKVCRCAGCAELA